MTSQAEPNWEAFYRDYRKPGFIPGYEILNKLGGGAFGLVFKARKESIGKDYAVKFLKLDESNMRAAVLRELESVSLFAQIDHPNLVTIEDKGEIHGIPFIMMGYAGEGTLRDRIQDGSLNRESALALFTQVARGLKALHDHALVHFDIKPANVFLRGDVARLGDYGLSKLVSASHNSLSFGRGTPYYMAPELLQQRGDHRSDIYSLGVILFESLSGQLPFQGDSEWEILRHHEKTKPTFPASISPRERKVIARCMAKQPESRYQTVDALLEDLLGGVQMAAAAPKPAQRTLSTPPPLPRVPPRAPNRPATGRERRSRIQRAYAARRQNARRPDRPVEPSPAPQRGGFAWILLILVGLPFAALVLYGTSSVTVHGPSRHSPSSGTETSASAIAEDYAADPSAFAEAQPWQTQIRALEIPRDLDRRSIAYIKAIINALRRDRIDVNLARCKLDECRRAAVIIGANELVNLDYFRKQDARFSAKLQDALRPLTGFQFRTRFSDGKRIPDSVARFNRDVAEQFRSFVAKEYY